MCTNERERKKRARTQAFVCTRADGGESRELGPCSSYYMALCWVRAEIAVGLTASYDGLYARREQPLRGCAGERLAVSDHVL